MSKKSHKALASATVMSLILTSTLTATVSAATGVERLSGSNRETTAIDVATKVFEKAETVVLVNGYKSADALSATPLAKAYNAPILSVGAVDEPTAALTKALADLGAKKVIVVGGEGAVTKALATKLAETYTVERIEGKDRYATNVAVAEKVMELKKSKEAFVVNGSDASYADALSIASIAASKGAPIVFTNGKTVSEEAKALVKGLEVTAIGGTGVVSADVLAAVDATRVGGADRFATNLEVLKAYKDVIKLDNVFVAYGLNFADALVASAAAAKTDAPVVLADKTNTKFTEGATDFIEANKAAIKNVYLVGGTGVIADSVKNTIDGIVNPVVGELKVESVKVLNGRQLQVTFNKSVDVDSAEDVTNYSIKPTGTAAIAMTDATGVNDATASVDGRIVTITLENALTHAAWNSIVEGDAFLVKVSGVTDVAGKEMKDQDISVVYTDKVAPTFVSASAKAANNTKRVTLTFSEPVDRNTGVYKINGKVATVQTALGKVKEVVLDAADNLVAGQTYTIEMTNVKDIAGNLMESNPTTGSVTVIKDATAEGVKNITVVSDNKIDVEFGEAMDSTTINTTNVKIIDYNTNPITAYTIAPKSGDTTGTIYRITFGSGSNLYASKDALNISITFTSSIKDASNNAITAETRSVTMTKDAAAPVIQTVEVVSAGGKFNNAVKATGGLVITFNKSIKLPADVSAGDLNRSKVTVIDQDGADVTNDLFTAATITGTELKSTDSKVLFIPFAVTPATSVKTATVRLAAKAFTDASLGTNSTEAKVITGVDFANATGTEDTTKPALSAAARVGVTNNISFTITEANLDKATVLNLDNYRLDGKPLPSGAYVTLTTAGSTHTAIINMPAGSVEKTRTNYAFTIVGIKDKSGNTASTLAVNNISLTDDAKPVFTSAKLNTDGTITLMFNEDVTGVVEADLVIKADGTTLATSDYTVASITAGDNKGGVIVTVTGVDANSYGTLNIATASATVGADAATNTLKADVKIAIK